VDVDGGDALDFESQYRSSAAIFGEPNRAADKPGRSDLVRVACLIFGPLLILAGLVLLVYFSVVYDTTVAVLDFDRRMLHRVHNLGLMQNRLIGIVVGIAAAGAGLALTLVGLLRARSTDA
jgi:hypothetical protein